MLRKHRPATQLETSKNNHESWRFLLGVEMWRLTGIALISFFVGGCGESANPTAKTEEPPHRKTFDARPQDLIDRYNKIAIEIDPALKLPPATAMADGGKNNKFHALMHTVKENLHVSIEIDNDTGKPFSISVTAAPSNQEEKIALVGVIPSIGGAVFGKGEQAGILINLCSKTEGKDPVTMKIGELEAYCANSMGLWIAGISVSKEESMPLKTTN